MNTSFLKEIAKDEELDIKWDERQAILYVGIDVTVTKRPLGGAALEMADRTIYLTTPRALALAAMLIAATQEDEE